MAKVRTSLDPDADLVVLHQLRGELPSSMVLMVDGNENFSVTTALRLATGNLNDPVSANQTLGNYGGRYTIGVDQAYLRWTGQSRV